MMNLLNKACDFQLITDGDYGINNIHILTTVEWYENVNESHGLPSFIMEIAKGLIYFLI